MTVRVHAIDAPEHGQAYGRRAKQALAALVARQRVRLRCVDTDPYGRQVCQVRRLDATHPGNGNGNGDDEADAGLALVRQGLAWWYERYADAQSPEDRARYAAAQRQARQAGLGLWRDGAAAEPPWAWRREHPRTDTDGPR